MSVLSIGRHRLRIDIRLERVAETPGSGQQRYLERIARDQALAERANWEIEHRSRVGWLR